MGIFSMKGYNKPGKGVDDLAPGNDGAMLFFEIFIRKFWKLIQTNLLFCVANIPAFLIIYFLAGTFSNAIFGTFPNEIAGIVGLSEPDLNNADYRMIYMIIDIGVRVCAATLFTIFWGSGPATAGMHYIFRNYAREENAFILSDFWDAIKDNFKQSLAVFIIDILFMFIFFYGIYFYSSQTNILRFAKYILYCLFIFYTIVHLFIYPLMVRYKLSLGKLLKNAALFLYGKPALQFPCYNPFGTADNRNRLPGNIYADQHRSFGTDYYIRTAGCGYSFRFLRLYCKL